LTGSSSRRVLVCIGCLLIAVFAVACNDEDDPDAVADLECDELVEIIYDDCDTNLPLHDGAHPDRGDARTYCRDDQFYDWACIDDCVFENKGLCTSLALCLEDCGSGE